MATRTISNAGGNWSSTGAWVEGAVPTSADDVVATATSGNLAVDSISDCRSIDLTGYTGTLSGSSNIRVGDATDPPANSAILLPTSGYTLSWTGGFILISTSATVLSVDCGGKTIASIGNTGTGSYTLSRSVTISGAFSLTGNTFDLNGFDLTCATFSSTGGTRTLTLGSGTMTVTGNNATIITLTNSSTFTINRGTNPIICNYSGSVGTRTISTAAVAEAKSLPIRISAGTDTVTFSSTSTVHDLSFSGFTGTFTVPATSFNVYGNLVLGFGMTYTANSNTLTMGASSGTKTITTNGVTVGSTLGIGASGSTATFQLQDNLTLSSSRTLGFTQGTFDANDRNVSIGLFSSTNANARTLLMGNGTWTLTATSGTVWNTAAATNFTVDPEQSTLVVADNGNKTIGVGAGITFYNFTIAVATARTITFTDSRTVTATNSLTLTGSAGQLLTLQGSSASGWTLAVPSTQSLGYLSVSRSTATGNTALAGSTSTDGGNNVNWNFGTSAAFPYSINGRPFKTKRINGRPT